MATIGTRGIDRAIRDLVKPTDPGIKVSKTKRGRMMMEMEIIVVANLYKYKIRRLTTWKLGKIYRPLPLDFHLML